MVWLRQLTLYLHLLAAAFWIGEILFVAVVVGPASRGLSGSERIGLLRDVGRRTLPLVWTSIAVLIVTGFGNLYFLGVRAPELVRPRFYATGFGLMLAGKLAAAFGMFGHAAMHDFVYGRRARRLRARIAVAEPEYRPDLEAEYARMRRASAAIGKGNLWLAFIVLLFAAGLGART